MGERWRKPEQVEQRRLSPDLLLCGHGDGEQKRPTVAALAGKVKLIS